MKIDQKGIDLITKWEGLKLKPYLCSAGVPTIGYGSTYYANGTKVTLKDPEITKECAVELFKSTIKNYENAVTTMIGSKTITQNQFNALVSFAYNLGNNALRTSTLLKKVLANPNDKTIENEFNKWVNAGSKKLQGLVNRRKEEAQMYFSK